MITHFEFERQEVRTFLIGGEVWFLGKDVCDILEISKYRDSLARLDEDEGCPVLVDTLGGKQTMTAISESGLYTLILTSRKPQAKAFKKWITSEVLPSIRKTGKYEVKPQKPSAIQLYSKRLEILGETLIKPNDTWCVIEHCSHLLLDIEKRGMIINRHSLLDGSIGKRWSSYRKDFDWKQPSYFAEYDFRDERGRQQIKAYDYAELQYFVKWLDNIYKLNILPFYIAEQMNKGSLVKA